MEEHLAQNTLWPEVRKLYGHGNDVYCLAADPRGRYLASACRAQSAATAGIWVWDVAGKWVGLGALAAHTLTVTQLAFSPDGRYLASASRDRSVVLFEHCQQGAEALGLLGCSGRPGRTRLRCSCGLAANLCVRLRAYVREYLQLGPACWLTTPTGPNTKRLLGAVLQLLGQLPVRAQPHLVT